MYNYFLKHTICLALLAAFCLGAGAQDGLGLTTLVIDAGHGGTDPGCISKDKKTFEKNLTLDIAKRLVTKLNEAYPDVKVVMTRSTDVFVPLNDRAAKANKAGANLFMSIHINSAEATSASGFSVHVLGQSSIKNRDLYAGNLDVVKRENSVILLEDDYSANYQGFDPNDTESYIFLSLMQNSNLEQSLSFAQYVSDNLAGGPLKRNRGISQDPFLVLWRTSMPAVLVELGFISNADDLAQLRTADSRDKIATRLLKAFGQYKADYDKSVNIAAPAKAEAPKAEAPKTEAPKTEAPKAAAPKTDAAKAPAAKVVYATQVSAVARLLKASDKLFLGYPAAYFRVNNLYKYVIGVSESEAEARAMYKKIHAVNKDSFFVKLDPSQLTDLK